MRNINRELIEVGAIDDGRLETDFLDSFGATVPSVRFTIGEIIAHKLSTKGLSVRAIKSINSNTVTISFIPEMREQLEQIMSELNLIEASEFEVKTGEEPEDGVEFEIRVEEPKTPEAPEAALAA